ncbi:MAG TPA: choice-of-anchor P family protein [Acidimicrobiales bacterium]|nr:choice-of-anchor P family protein [Acidimicrobiales bacterium]
MSRATFPLQGRRSRRRAVRAALGALLGMGSGGALAVGMSGAGAHPAWADGAASFQSFQTGAEAPVFQITEDAPTATFHPQGEGNYNYTQATLDPSRGYGLASLYWPGGTAANAGALLVLLGAPPQAGAASYPVRAEAVSGTSQTKQDVTTPSGTQMSASVEPAKPGQQSSTAQTKTAGGALGPLGTVGQSTSSSSVVLDPASNVLTSTAQTVAGNISLAGGVVTIGSVTSTAKAVSKAAATPAVSGSTVVQDMKIAGQESYVDGSGVHAGSPGHPAPPTEQAVIDAALKGAGMSVYFTDPHTVPIGGVQYYVAGSVLFFWAPPGDSNQDSFTLSMGGSAVSMGVTAGAANPALPTVTAPEAPTSPAGPDVSQTALAAALGPPPSGTDLSLPSSSPGASISAGVGRGTTGPRSAGVLTGAALPGGLGWGLWALIVLGGIAGALALPLVPGLFDKTAAAACPRERRP